MLRNLNYTSLVNSVIGVRRIVRAPEVVRLSKACSYLASRLAFAEHVSVNLRNGLKLDWIKKWICVVSCARLSNKTKSWRWFKKVTVVHICREWAFSGSSNRIVVSVAFVHEKETELALGYYSSDREKSLLLSSSLSDYEVSVCKDVNHFCFPTCQDPW